MKIRSDFVTNSSSSSFVLSFVDAQDLKFFDERCRYLYYDSFYRLIDNFASDYILFSNETKSSIPFSELAKSIENYDFPECFTNELKKLCAENYILPPFGNKCISLNNPLKGEYFDAKTLGFKTIENNRFAIELIENSKYRSKEEAIAILRQSYIVDYQNSLIQYHVKIRKDEGPISYILRKEEYIRSSEHQHTINEFLKKTNFEEKKKKIEDSILTINGQIWDNSGGLLEWAIRNGFIEDNFGHNCITVWNVG